MPDTTPALVDFAVVLPTAYLPLVLRSSVSRVQDCVDLAVNGGFEAEGGWDLVNEAGYEAALRYAGARSMRVGIPVGQTNPYTDPLYSSVAQTVTLPAGRAITLSYREFPLCESNDPDDMQYVWLLDQGGRAHFLASGCENLGTWVLRQHDLTTYAGQTVLLRFSVKNDVDDDTTVSYLDDVRIDACPN